MMLKESSQSPTGIWQRKIDAPLGKKVELDSEDIKYRHEGQEAPYISKLRPQIFGDFDQNMIVRRKLSSILDASPLKNSCIGRMIHDRY